MGQLGQRAPGGNPLVILHRRSWSADDGRRRRRDHGQRFIDLPVSCWGHLSEDAKEACEPEGLERRICFERSAERLGAHIDAGDHLEAGFDDVDGLTRMESIEHLVVDHGLQQLEPPKAVTGQGSHHDLGGTGDRTAPVPQPRQVDRQRECEQFTTRHRRRMRRARPAVIPLGPCGPSRQPCKVSSHLLLDLRVGPAVEEEEQVIEIPLAHHVRDGHADIAWPLDPARSRSKDAAGSLEDRSARRDLCGHRFEQHLPHEATRRVDLVCVCPVRSLEHRGRPGLWEPQARHVGRGAQSSASSLLEMESRGPGIDTQAGAKGRDGIREALVDPVDEWVRRDGSIEWPEHTDLRRSLVDQSSGRTFVPRHHAATSPTCCPRSWRSGSTPLVTTRACPWRRWAVTMATSTTAAPSDHHGARHALIGIEDPRTCWTPPITAP